MLARVSFYWARECICNPILLIVGRPTVMRGRSEARWRVLWGRAQRLRSTVGRRLSQFGDITVMRQIRGHAVYIRGRTVQGAIARSRHSGIVI